MTHAEPSRPFAKLLARLQLDQASEWEYVGGAGIGGTTVANRLYGGLVLAQTGMAAMRTVEGFVLHSVHGHFLRPGQPDQDIHFLVDPVKQGRNFQVRHVRAEQDGKLIFQLTASFAGLHEDVEHQDDMPAAPQPESLPNRDQLRGRARWQDQPIDVRLCDPVMDGQPLPPSKSVWLRTQSAPPEDPNMHAALLLYASDRAFLSTAWRPHAGTGELGGASLDHTVWFHDQVRFDDWLLYTSHSPAARYQRGLVQGAIYRADGRRIASVAQEGLLRRT